LAIGGKEQQMKHIAIKLEIILTLAVITAFVSASTFARAGKQDFIVHNETGVEIKSLYVSPHSADDWEADILGRDTLPNGESVKINFNDRDKHTHWDLKVTDKGGNALEWYDLNLLEIKELTLRYDAEKHKAWADIK
jgi:hypothetical protein